MKHILACLLLIACGSEPSKGGGTGGAPGMGGTADGTGGASATGGSTGTGGGAAGAGGSADAGPGPGMDTAPGADTMADTTDSCGPVRCLSALSIEGSSFKDKNSNRGVISRACLKDGQFVETVQQQCAYAETCENATCVSCGSKGARYLKETVGTAVTRDCEGCACNFSFGCYGAGQGGPPGGSSVNVTTLANANFFIMADGKPWTASSDKDLKVEVRKVNKLEVMPGGAIDVEFVIDNVKVDNFGARTAVHVEARLVGNCAP